MDVRLKEIETELKSQKKNPKKYDNLNNKENMFKLMKERNELLRNKLNGVSIEEKKYEGNKNIIEAFDDLMEKYNKAENEEQREIYEEEQNKINEWNAKIEQQNEDLNDILIGIRNIKKEAEIANEKINTIGAHVNGLTTKVEGTSKKVKTQNERLKDLLNKIRKSDKICCDIILILILIGLIMVLYRIIKKKK